MTRFISIFSLSISICSALFGQDKIIFKDDFHNNENNWRMVGDTEFSVNIDHNAIIFRKNHKNHVNSGCLWYQKDIENFHSNKDFIISFDAKILYSDDIVNGFDFQWGQFNGIAPNGGYLACLYQLDFQYSRVRLSKFDNTHGRNGWEYYKWSEDLSKSVEPGFALKIGANNSFEIKQIDTTLTVSINNKLVYAIPVEKINGKSIGVQQCLRRTWSMSNLYIKQDYRDFAIKK